jgi:FkbM family methyltransferase
MRKALNRVLAPLGYRLERISPFKRQLQSLLSNKEHLKFVQIGANDGIRFDGLYEFVTQHGCAGIVVEPLPDLWERLRFNYSDYPRIKPIQAAVHETAAVMPIYRVSPQGLTSLPDWSRGLASFSREHLLTHGVPPELIVCEHVPCVPLMKLLSDNDCMDADFIQIDTEGFDIEILKMIDFQRFHPPLIKYEHKNASPAERTFAGKLLRSHGYTLAKDRGDTVAWLRR